MYTAIVLDESCRDVMLKSFHDKHHVPSGWVTKAHHVTVNMGPWDEELNPKELMGKSVCFCTDKLILATAPDDGIIAYTFKGLPSFVNYEGDKTINSGEPCPINIKNKHPHLTMFHAPDVRPVKSNHLLEQAARLGEREAADRFGLRYDQGYYLTGNIVEVKDNHPCPTCGAERE